MMDNTARMDHSSQRYFMITGLILILIEGVVRLLHSEPSSHPTLDEEVHIDQHYFFCSIRSAPIFPLAFPI